MRRFLSALLQLILACNRFGVEAIYQLSEREVANHPLDILASFLLTSRPRPVSSRNREALERLRGGSLLSSATRTLEAQGDEVVLVVASCGAGVRSPAVTEALAAPQDVVSIVPNEIPIVLYNVASASESDASIAVAAADVVTLEVRFDDLVQRTPHGLAQLRPLLRRLDPTSIPKLLLLVVSDYDASEASEEQVNSFVKSELAELTENLQLSAADLWESRLVLLPSRSSPGYEVALSKLQGILSAQASSFPSLASASSETIKQAGQRIVNSATLSASPTKVHASYKSSMLADHALSEFQAGAVALQYTAGNGLMTDFADQATAVMEQALTTFDNAAGGSASPSIAAARAAVVEQMHRALYGSFRKQLAALQRNFIGYFMEKVENAQPSGDLPVRLKSLLKETMKEFEVSTKALLPAGVPWSCTYETAAIKEFMEDAVRDKVESEQMKGLHISKKRRRIPIDFSAHWLSLNPFGRTQEDAGSVDDPL